MVETIGPFSNGEYYYLTVDGYRVPHMIAHLRKGTEDVWDIILDGRFGYELTDKELHSALPLLANAIAIAAGYSCFGENCVPLNPFKEQMIGISTVSTEGEAKNDQ